jgi:hypothetical protein
MHATHASHSARTGRAAKISCQRRRNSRASVVKRYTDRPMTAYEHGWEIRRVCGYRDFSDAEASGQLRECAERRFAHVQQFAAQLHAVTGRQAPASSGVGCPGCELPAR